MSAHADPQPHGASAPAAPHEHASVRTYVRVAIILTLVTALEVGVIYIRALTPIIVPLLLVMSAAKFALVVHVLHAPALRRASADHAVSWAPCSSRPAWRSRS